MFFQGRTLMNDMLRRRNSKCLTFALRQAMQNLLANFKRPGWFVCCEPTPIRLKVSRDKRVGQSVDHYQTCLPLYLLRQVLKNGQHMQRPPHPTPHIK
jgi:hypothetical protein